MSFGLKLYLAAAKRAGLRSLRLHKRNVEPSAHKRLARPAGKLVWFHISDTVEIGAVKELIRLLSDEHDQLSFLVTTPESLPADIRFQDFCAQPCLQIPTPSDTPQHVDQFLDHWQPTIVIWTGSLLRPALAIGTNRRKIALFMINARKRAKIDGRSRNNKGIIADVLGLFQHILTDTDQAARDIVRQGAAAGNVIATGLLEEGSTTLYCDDRERDEMAQTLTARPIWLAIGLTQSEEASISAAHRSASRLSHRLLLVIIPQNPDRGNDIAKILSKDGWEVAQRSLDQDPDEHTQILIADTGDETGLWLRLAPVCFIGNSFGLKATGISPFNAAASGSAILHGPNVEHYKDAYDRLASAGAARKIINQDQLGQSIQELLAPDIAAVMAHAGWEVSTSGAQAADHAVEMIATALDKAEDV